jgi:D-alanine-D-alanine ligase
MKIAVLMGGASAERDVSLASGAGVVSGLKQAGHEVVPIDTARGFQALNMDDIERIEKVKNQPPSTAELQKYAGELTIQAINSADLRGVDVVFIILHGGAGENGTIQALLDLVNIPYTGSGVLASALAMDKFMAKQIFTANNIPTPDYFVVDKRENKSIDEIARRIGESIGYPVIAKPNSQGSSVGLSCIKSKDQLGDALALGFQYDNRILFEKFIAGREFTVSILGNEPLPLVEIIPEGGLYDYEHKYIAGKTNKACPVDLPEKFQKMIQQIGLKAFQSLGCRGFGRVDFRFDNQNNAYCLEVNTLPGMTATSLVPKAAKAAGIEFPQLLDKICQIAISDFKSRRNN